MILTCMASLPEQVKRSLLQHEFSSSPEIFGVHLLRLALLVLVLEN
jgi:hypothetical protein